MKNRMLKIAYLVSLVFSWNSLLVAQTIINDFDRVPKSLLPLAEAARSIADRYVTEGKALKYKMVGIPTKDQQAHSTIGFEFLYGDISGYKLMIGEMDDEYTMIQGISFAVEGVDGSDPDKVNKVVKAFQFPRNLMKYEATPKKGENQYFTAQSWGSVPRKAFAKGGLDLLVDERVNVFLNFYRQKKSAYRIILKEGDEITRLRQIMSGTGINHILDADGDALVKFNFTDTKRKQKVWVGSKMTPIGSYQLRKIFSYAYVGEKRPAEEVLIAALAENNVMSTSRWALTFTEADKSYVLMLTALVPDAADDKTIASLVRGAGSRADDFEKKYFDNDSH